MRIGITLYYAAIGVIIAIVASSRIMITYLRRHFHAFCLFYCVRARAAGRFVCVSPCFSMVCDILLLFGMASAYGYNCSSRGTD